MKKLFTLLISSILLAGFTMAQTNLVVNGDLTEWTDDNHPTGWYKAESITKEATVVHGETGFSAMQTSSGSKKIFSTKVEDLTAGKTYKIKFWYLDNDISAKIRLWANWYTAAGAINSNDDLHWPFDNCSENNAEWVYKEYVLEAPENVQGFNFELRLYSENGSGGNVYYDDFSITEVVSGPSLAITAPAAGAQWLQGSTQNITWSAEAITNTLKLEYTADATVAEPVWMPLATSVDAAAGTWSWTLDAAQTPGTNYKVRLTEEGGEMEALSEAFSIVAPEPTLTVTAPVAGAQWLTGNTEAITWSSAFITGTVKIEYTANATAADPDWVELTNSLDAAAGTWSWAIPADQAVGTDYQIRISVEGSEVSEVSGIFSIAVPVPALTVTAPVQGGTYFSNTTEEITWEAENITANLKIELTANASDETPVWSTIATGVDPTAGLYSTLIPADTPMGSDYQIGISVEGSEISALSGIFTIRPEAFDVANIAALRNGEINEKYHLTGEALVTFVQAYRNQKFIQDATGAILVDDQNNVLPSDYVIGDGVTGLTGKLTNHKGMLQFVPVNAGNITLTHGNAVTPVIMTMDQLVNNFEQFEAQLVTINNVAFTATGNFANGQTYAFGDVAKLDGNFRTSFFDADYVGEAIPEGSMNLTGILNARDGEFITARNAADMVSTMPVIEFTAPVAGTNWIQGTEQNITWTAANTTATLALDYTADATAEQPVWVSLATGVDAAAGTYAWTIAADQATGDNYKVRLSEETTKHEVMSEAFSIVTPEPTLTVTAPEAGAVLITGSEQAINWVATNVTETLKIELTANASDEVPVWSSLATDLIAADGTYAWTLAGDLVAGTDYQIRISSEISKISAVSGIFSVEAPEPVLTVTSPVEGAVYYTGSTQNITWTAENIIETLQIDLTANASAEEPVWVNLTTGVVAAAGTYEITIPADQAMGEDYQIRISSEIRKIAAVSGIFSIRPDTIEVANIAALRNGFGDDQQYKLTGEAIITFMQASRNQKFIQDATAAILIDDAAGKLTTVYSVGDGITGLTGTLSEYGNMLQFVPSVDADAATSTGNTVTPEVVTLAQITSDFGAYESELVQINEVTFADGGSAFANYGVYAVTDASKGDGNFRASFKNVDYIGSDIAAQYESVTAICNAREDGNYITARNAADFVATANPVLVVTAPQAGANWHQGDTRAITWSAANTGATLNIELTADASAATPVWTSLATDVDVTTGTWNWVIPADQALGIDYQIRMTTTESKLMAVSGIFNIAEPLVIPALVMTEIMYNPPESGVDSLEFIEVYNNSDVAVQMEGIHFGTPFTFAFPAVELEPKGYILVASNASAMMNNFNVTAYEAISTGLGNGGKLIQLFDAEENLIDEVEYDNVAPWPTEPNGDGPSLTLCDPSKDNSLGENWSAATEATGVIINGKEMKCTPGAGCSLEAGIHVQQPAAGVQWLQGSEHNILFIAVSTNATVSIDYTADASSATPTWTSLATGVDATAGTWSWTIPADLAAGSDYKVRITDGDVTGESGVFGIIQSVIEVATIADLRAGIQGGQEYKLTGEALLTFKQAFRGQKYVQDATGAILIDDNEHVITTEYSVGDGITGLTGTLLAYGNMLQFVPTADAGAATSTGNTIIAQTVTLAQLTANFTDYESELVKVVDVQFTATGNFANGTAYDITDASKGEGKFRTSFYDVDYIGTAIAAQYESVTAICNARNDGNYITARDAADMVPVAVEPPVADFTADPVKVLVGNTVNFTSTSTGAIDSYAWTFEAGTPATSTEQNPVITYSELGTFDVSLTVTNAGGSDTETKTGYITVEPVGLDEEGMASLLVFPNPAQNSVTISTNWNQYQVEIISLTGQVIRTVKSATSATQVNVTNISEGLYMLRLTNSDNHVVLTSRLVIK